VRQLLDMKIKPLVEGFDAPMMVRHADIAVGRLPAPMRGLEMPP
jgi:hypothetical protein